MAVAKKKPVAKKPTELFIGIKESCDNIGDPRKSIADVIKEAKGEIGYGDIDISGEEDDSVTVYKLVPVKKLTVTTSIIETDL